MHEGGGASRVADLVHAVPHPQGARRAGVDDEPGFGESQVAEGDVERCSDRAAGAVAAEDRGGVGELFVAVVLVPYERSAGPVRDSGDGGIAPECDPWVLIGGFDE